MNLFFAVFSAALFIAAFPNFNFSSLGWVALTPLATAIFYGRPRHSFLLGWLSGTLAYAGILFWLITTFQAAHQSMGLTIFCLLLLSAYLGSYWGAWTWALSFFAREKRFLFPIYGAAVWVVLEYLRTYLFSGFPWALLGDSQYRNLPLIQIASLTGVYGVSFLMTFVSLSPLIGKKALAWALGLVFISGCYGVDRMKDRVSASGADAVRVALLQGSIDQYKKWNAAYVDEIQQTYARLSTAAAREGAQLIVWPETSIPGYLPQDTGLLVWLKKIIRKSGAHHLVGTPSGDNGYAYNSALAFYPDGNLEGGYSKEHLVPFGEIVPASNVLGRYIHVLNELGGFTAGRVSPVLTVDHLRIGVNICYESIFPNEVRRSVARGAELIANLTNDGWYMRTAEPYQHLAPNVFRAVENDRWVLRADNTGISALIDPRGRIVNASPLFESCVLEGRVAPRQSLTLYTRLGDWFAWACVILCFLMWGASRSALRRI